MAALLTHCVNAVVLPLSKNKYNLNKFEIKSIYFFLSVCPSQDPPYRDGEGGLAYSDLKTMSTVTGLWLTAVPDLCFKRPACKSYYETPI